MQWNDCQMKTSQSSGWEFREDINQWALNEKQNENKQRRVKTSPAWIFALKNTEHVRIHKVSEKRAHFLPNPSLVQVLILGMCITGGWREISGNSVNPC